MSKKKKDDTTKEEFEKFDYMKTIKNNINNVNNRFIVIDLTLNLWLFCL